ncbi:YggS family pyridoxal phosphate enzyme [Plasmodium yoelii 17X]|uniref:Pyridoxal phosphate homeostasis protein n=3 Tax=Plasmodium yoelii TaxID=5861 RepID=A0AAF0B461_PLAYO|nr:pyridoxal phosphate homeostasis protein, putative [Plasmodium yoelii]ETB60249.1 YggS family pyridoxal phosphate enzyme [Plasmodium yoelii 17X]WBY56774.1 pyridoxal phosphate homeostasis protein [Plasmodium yoelii yoelii]CDU17598.1 pyridoxal 5'-phosphate dependent enzyme class III, putative [Plasmodium yoelii]VTZ77474.1 pyridoxal phosphate homeostasis protein, putative [Plasmodium yoelii]|eukprot:XP_022811973.1 pyridoxal phosphate homeostasis protein, putative [Plasmodium yoelii]
MKHINNIKNIENKIEKICQDTCRIPPKILIVSKYVGHEEINNIHSYEKKYHFGENNFDSLIEKSQKLPNTIKWHFIGNIQSNKCKNILKVPNLYMIESLDKQKKANLLNSYLNTINENEQNNNDNLKKLRVLVQIKTTDDPNKTGMMHDNYEDIENTVLYIINNCNFLIFKGLMTISSLDINNRENSFIILNDIKNKLLNNQTISNYFQNKKFHMSMGMSDDLELAIKNNTTQLRIGRAIFG